MRQVAQEVTDEAAIQAFLQREPMGFLGLADGEVPYVVPMNFVRADRTIYLHSARDGHKWQVLRRNPRATFAVARWYGTLPDAVPCRIDTAYFSVLAEGILRIVEDIREETAALRLVLAKYLPEQPPRLTERSVEEYRSSLGSRVGVLALDLTAIHAKANGLEGADLRPDWPGRSPGGVE